MENHNLPPRSKNQHFTVDKELADKIRLNNGITTAADGGCTVEEVKDDNPYGEEDFKPDFNYKPTQEEIKAKFMKR